MNSTHVISQAISQAMALSLTLTLAACGGKAQLPLGFTLPAGNPEGAVPASASVFLVADNQQQYLYGKPVWIRTALVDKFVASAIRAPQLDLFGPSILEWIVDTYSEQAPIIHLGDALNLSCRDEFEQFMRTMSKAQNGWFMAPGNHDGIYFGSSGSAKEWALVCDRPAQGSAGADGRFDKAMFIEGYMNHALVPHQGLATLDPGVGSFAAWRQSLPKPAGRSPRVERWDYPGTDNAWLTGVAYRIDAAKSYRSFIVQELTPTLHNRRNPYVVKYILLDTSDFEHSPELIPIPPHLNAGSTGEISQAQFDVVESWLKRDADVQAGQPLPIVVMMGHHPFNALTEAARNEFERLRRQYRVLLYVSAHTHRGDYFIHGDDDVSWLELNLGSVVDWPLEFREFKVLSYTADDGSRRLYTDASLNELQDELEGFDCNQRWQPQQGDADYYVDYVEAVNQAPEATANLVFNSLLQSYVRLLHHLPTAADNQAWPRFGNAALQGDRVVLDRISSLVRPESTNLDHKRTLLASLEKFDFERALAALPVLLAATSGSGGAPGEASPPAEPAAGLSPAVAPRPGSEAEEAVRVRHRQYRLCQAFWASMDDETGARRARRKDWFVAYPPKFAK